VVAAFDPTQTSTIGRDDARSSLHNARMAALFCAAFALFLLLALHHFVKARRGVRTGVVEGLMVGFWGKRYSRTDNPDAFLTNVYAGYSMAALGAVAFLFAVLVTVMALMDRPGFGPL
jgi:hypothetical protein